MGASRAPRVPTGPGAVSVTPTGVSRGGLGPRPQPCVCGTPLEAVGQPPPGCSRVDRAAPHCSGTLRPPDQETAVLESVSQGQQEGHSGGGGHRLAPPLWFLQEGASQARGAGLGLAGSGRGAQGAALVVGTWPWVTSGPQSETQSRGDRWALQRLVCTCEVCSQVGEGFLPQVFAWLSYPLPKCPACSQS